MPYFFFSFLKLIHSCIDGSIWKGSSLVWRPHSVCVTPGPGPCCSAVLFYCYIIMFSFAFLYIKQAFSFGFSCRSLWLLSVRFCSMMKDVMVLYFKACLLHFGDIRSWVKICLIIKPYVFFYYLILAEVRKNDINRLRNF